MKFLKISTILVLIIFPFGELLRFDMGNNIVIKPLDILVGFTVGWWIFNEAKNAKRKTQNDRLKLKALLENKVFIAVVSFSLIGLFSLFINLTWLKPQEFFVSFLYLLRWTAYAGMFFVISEFDKKFKKKIGIFLLIDGLLILLFGYLQYFFYNSLKNLYYLGWDEHMHRMFSIFFDPNFAGAFLVLYALFIGGLLKKSTKNKYTVVLFIILSFSLIAVFLTFSRSALLMLIVGSIIFLTLIERKKLIFIILAAILLFGILSSPKFYDENMNLFRTNSTGARIADYSAALRVISDHPIIGVGFNSYRYTKKLYKMDHDWTKAPSHADAGVDNSFLFVLATTGIVGLSAYIYLWYLILSNAFYLYKKNKNVLAVVVISSSTGLFVSAFFINSLFFASIMLWMWVITGLMQDN